MDQKIQFSVEATTDGGCQEELVLLPEDIQALKIPLVRVDQVDFPDGSTRSCSVYEGIIMGVRFSDGSHEFARVSPCVLEEAPQSDTDDLQNDKQTVSDDNNTISLAHTDIVHVPTRASPASGNKYANNKCRLLGRIAMHLLKLQENYRFNILVRSPNRRI
jgi:hypothetical protein